MVRFFFVWLYMCLLRYSFRSNLQRALTVTPVHNHSHLSFTNSFYRKKAREACKIASTTGDTIRHRAKVLFSPEEWMLCTVHSRHTNKAVEQSTALNATKLNFFICKWQVHYFNFTIKYENSHSSATHLSVFVWQHSNASPWGQPPGLENQSTKLEEFPWGSGNLARQSYLGDMSIGRKSPWHPLQTCEFPHTSIFDGKTME